MSVMSDVSCLPGCGWACAVHKAQMMATDVSMVFLAVKIVIIVIDDGVVWLFNIKCRQNLNVAPAMKLMPCEGYPV